MGSLRIPEPYGFSRRSIRQILGADAATKWLEKHGEAYCVENFAYAKKRCKIPTGIANYLIKSLENNYANFFAPKTRVSVPLIGAVATPVAEPAKPEEIRSLMDGFKKRQAPIQSGLT